MTEQDQLTAIRQSLINTSFQHYNVLIQFLKLLPVNQQVPGMTQAYLQIDGAMLWIKEIIMTNPIILSPPAPIVEPDNENKNPD
jgi:hypothetical protein